MIKNSKLWLTAISAALLTLAPVEIASAQSGKAQPSTAEQDIQRADALNYQVRVLLEQRELEAALRLSREELALRRQVQGERDPATITVISDNAFLLEQLGRVQEAEPLYRQAYELFRDVLGERDENTIVALSDYALILQVLGRSDEALPLYATLVETSTDAFGEADANTLIFRANYGRVLFALGRNDESEASLRETLNDLRTILGETNPFTIYTLSYYASVLEAQGRGEEAEPLHAQVLALRRELLGEQHPETIEAYNNYGVALQRLDREEEAEPFLARTLELSREVLGPTHPTSLFALNNYGSLLDVLGRDGEAEPLYREAVQLQRGVLGERHPLTMISLHNLAVILDNLDRRKEAIPVYAEALPLFREVLGAQHPQTLMLKFNYAVSLLTQRQFQPALDLTREVSGTMRARAVDLSSRGVRGSSQSARELVGRQDSEKFLADVLWGSRLQPGNDRDALASEAFIALQLASAGSTSNAVREAAAARFASAQGLDAVVRERQQLERDWVLLEGELVQNETLGAVNAEARQILRTRLDAIEARLDQIDAQLSEEAPQYFAILSQQGIALGDLRDVLSDDEAVLFLVPTEFGTHSMAVTKTAIEWRWKATSQIEIAEAVEEFRTGLEIVAGTEFLPVFDLELAHSLYADLIAPVEGALAGKSRVYVIADGALSRLPLGTLVTEPVAADADPEDMEVLREAPWLADKYALVQLPSVQSLVYIRSFGVDADAAGEAAYAGFGAPVLGGAARTRGARSATIDPVDASRLVGEVRAGTGLALMNPEALRKLSSLPGTKGELEQVRDALGSDSARLWLDTAMTEPAIREADLSSTSILHLATHGFTSEEAGGLAEPGLIFTPPTEASLEDDGYLAASEVVALDLALARWVILSACNTASPSGRPGETGLSGLAQAFFYAGAESLLVSHWPVFDDIAPILTVEALRLSEEGMPRAEALQAAMRSVRMNPDLDAAHPAVWAPFALVGEGR